MMRKFMQVLLLLAVIAAGVLAWVFIPSHETIGQKTLEQALNDDYSLVGHRIYSTDPDAGNRFGYFVLATGQSIEEQEPFLVTSDQFIRMEQTGDNTLSVTINGRIYHYHNALWVPKSDGKLQHFLVSATAKYVR
ncbi:TPA: hypothetical protein RG678_005080 [Vibrio alginolyticus]|nr:hypothetical protein [Vibrio alginolyticus]EGQ9716755.1 hypothetical protein [Vibrio alginolyticus]EGR2550397.1 hypothetical protein [Vibrio alginolyticus]EII3282348.1 hypothetical protein [Vibrio alginolyticus]EII3285106.1 hypothetical protein [Vibrio alginolyticus]